MKAKLGPNLVAHVKQVTPGALLAVHTIFMPLIQGGCENLVLQAEKVLVSLHTTVAEHIILVPQGTHCFSLPVLIHAVKDRIMQCAAIMRASENEGHEERVSSSL